MADHPGSHKGRGRRVAGTTPGKQKPIDKLKGKLPTRPINKGRPGRPKPNPGRPGRPGRPRPQPGRPQPIAKPFNPGKVRPGSFKGFKPR